MGYPGWSNIYFFICFYCISYLLAYVTLPVGEIDNNNQLQRTFPSLPGLAERGAHGLLPHILPYQLCQPHACDTPQKGLQVSLATVCHGTSPPPFRTVMTLSRQEIHT